MLSAFYTLTYLIFTKRLLPSGIPPSTEKETGFETELSSRGGICSQVCLSTPKFLLITAILLTSFDPHVASVMSETAWLICR